MTAQRETAARSWSGRKARGGGRTCPAWADHSPPQEFSIGEHAEAIAVVDSLRPYCSRWIVELERPEIAREIGMVVLAEGGIPAWAIYRDAAGMLHFEDLVNAKSYLFASMSAGLCLVKAVLEAAAVEAEERRRHSSWWERLPAWLLTAPVEG